MVKAGAQLLAAFSRPLQFEGGVAEVGGEAFLGFIGFQIAVQALSGSRAGTDGDE